jgi:hypothetical protein
LCKSVDIQLWIDPLLFGFAVDFGAMLVGAGIKKDFIPRSYHEVFNYLSTEVEDVGHNLAQRINEQARTIPRPAESTEMVKPVGIVHVTKSTPAQTIPIPQRVATSVARPPKLKVEVNRTTPSTRKAAPNIIPASRPVKQPQEMVRLKSGLVVAAN